MFPRLGPRGGPQAARAWGSGVAPVPLAYGGWGTELDGPQSAWIYWTGIKSSYRLSRDGPDWSLVNGLGFIGYTPDDGPSSSAVPLMAGLESRWRLGGRRLGGEPLYLNVHATYTTYLANLDFDLRGISDTRVADEWELGLALAKGEKKFGFWRLEWDRLGLAYRFSSSGEFQGVTLVLRSVFDR